MVDCILIKIECVFKSNFNYSKGSVSWFGSSILFRLINSMVIKK